MYIRAIQHAFILLAAVLVLSACNSNTSDHQLTEFNGLTMGTSWNVKVVDMPETINQPAVDDSITKTLVAISRSMSTYDAESELSQFNSSSSTDWFSASDALVEVLGAANEVSRLTGGAFDVTVGPLVNLWGFGPQGERTETPDENEIESARARTGYTNMEVRQTPAAIRKQLPGLYVDLSSIAKGYAVDRIAGLLEQQGIENYLVEAGFWQRVKGRIDFGFSYKTANNLLELSLSGTSNYRAEKWSSKIDFNIYFQSQDSVTTVTRRSIGFTGQRFFGHKWSGLGALSFEENSQLSLDLRTSFWGGSGLFVKQTNRAIAQVAGGLAVTNEKYTGEPQGQNNLELVLASELAYFRFATPETDISTSVEVFPNLTTLGRVRINLDFRFSYEILKDFTIGFTLYDNFDSQPPREGASKNDFGTELTVGWKYN